MYVAWTSTPKIAHNIRFEVFDVDYYQMKICRFSCAHTRKLNHYFEVIRNTLCVDMHMMVSTFHKPTCNRKHIKHVKFTLSRHWDLHGCQDCVAVLSAYSTVCAPCFDSYNVLSILDSEPPRWDGLKSSL
jgi:hypothetical protein